MIQSKKVWAFIFLALGLTSCAGNTDKLVPKPADNSAQNFDLGPINYAYSVPLDILFVVDNSGSMDEHQKDLANNVGDFIKGFSSAAYLDYHLGVTSSDEGDQGHLLDKVGGGLFVDSQTPNGLDVFRQNVQLGSSGSSTEMFFDPIFMALSAPVVNGYNAGFFRPEGYLAVVIVTDAEDQSTRMPDSKKLAAFLTQLKGGDPDKLITYGAIIPGPTTPPGCPTDGSWPPDNIVSFFKETNGTFFSLCDPTWGQKLALMGADLLQHVSKKIPLKQKPVVSTIQLTFGSQLIPNDADKGWTYDALKNVLYLGRNMNLAPEPKGTNFKVSFVPAEI